MSIEYVSFHPVKKDKSLIGFCTFQWDKKFKFYKVAVHKLLNPKGNIRIRLLYNDQARPKNETYNEILSEVNAYILANYREALDGNG